ncbi:MAG: hypothetical protein GQ559_11235 [Desulfobulbaceae bacterium]|nr:hypothetical protein [Desulfobulbaceae bacterium]
MRKEEDVKLWIIAEPDPRPPAESDSWAISGYRLSVMPEELTSEEVALLIRGKKILNAKGLPRNIDEAVG